MAAATEERKSLLILGGCGFIGRNLVNHLLKSNINCKVRVADKTPPQIAWLNSTHKADFKKIEFVSANLISEASVSKAFSQEDGKPFDIVVNLAAETNYGRTDAIYKEGTRHVSINCAQEAARTAVKRYIEFSTGQVYQPHKNASTEDSKLDPWTGIAKYKLMVEEILPTIEGLDYVILRPATVYGIGDTVGITPRLVIGAIYRHLGEKMKLLWTSDLRMSTVHVVDVCRAIWHVGLHGQKGDIYNVVDKSETTQGTIAELVCRIFDIQHDYFGTIVSNFAKLNMSDVVEDSNDKHMSPWSEVCQREGLQYTPLTPYLHQELLYNNHLYMDGSKLEKTGFQYIYPRITQELLQEILSGVECGAAGNWHIIVLDDYVSMGLFPKSLLPS